MMIDETKVAALSAQPAVGGAPPPPGRAHLTRILWSCGPNRVELQFPLSAEAAILSIARCCEGPVRSYVGGQVDM